MGPAIIDARNSTKHPALQPAPGSAWLGTCACLATGILMAWGACGCGSHPKGPPLPPKKYRAATSKPLQEKHAAETNHLSAPKPEGPVKFPVITALNPMRGMVTSVRRDLRFVVLDFGLNGTPEDGQRLGVFRNAQLVGKLKVSGKPQGTVVAADILEGSIEPGDEARPAER